MNGLFIRKKLYQIMTNKDIALAFSNGHFEQAYPYLADDVCWSVKGEESFQGKEAVVEQSQKIAAYFASVSTDFQTDKVLESGSTVVVAGTAEFFREGKSINFTSACDVYEFDGQGRVVGIDSYCVVHGK